MSKAEIFRGDLRIPKSSVTSIFQRSSSRMAPRFPMHDPTRIGGPFKMGFNTHFDRANISAPRRKPWAAIGDKPLWHLYVAEMPPRYLNCKRRSRGTRLKCMETSRLPVIRCRTAKQVSERIAEFRLLGPPNCVFNKNSICLTENGRFAGTLLKFFAIVGVQHSPKPKDLIVATPQNLSAKHPALLLKEGDVAGWSALHGDPRWHGNYPSRHNTVGISDSCHLLAVWLKDPAQLYMRPWYVAFFDDYSSNSDDYTPCQRNLTKVR